MKRQCCKTELKAFIPRNLYDAWDDFITLEGEPVSVRRECCDKCKSVYQYGVNGCLDARCLCHSPKEEETWLCQQVNYPLMCTDLICKRRPPIEPIEEVKLADTNGNPIHSWHWVAEQKINELVRAVNRLVGR